MIYPQSILATVTLCLALSNIYGKPQSPSKVSKMLKEWNASIPKPSSQQKTPSRSSPEFRNLYSIDRTPINRTFILELVKDFKAQKAFGLEFTRITAFEEKEATPYGYASKDNADPVVILEMAACISEQPTTSENYLRESSGGARILIKFHGKLKSQENWESFIVYKGETSILVQLVYNDFTCARP